MATKKSGGTAKNLRDSNPKFLGVKIQDGSLAKTGAIIVRQRGTKILPGLNVGLAKDHSIFALKTGKVKFNQVRKTAFDGRSRLAKKVCVVV